MMFQRKVPLEEDEEKSYLYIVLDYYCTQRNHLMCCQWIALAVPSGKNADYRCTCLGCIAQWSV
jgi:hypothetical protein